MATKRIKAGELVIGPDGKTRPWGDTWGLRAQEAANKRGTAAGKRGSKKVAARKGGKNGSKKSGG